MIAPFSTFWSQSGRIEPAGVRRQLTIVPAGENVCQLQCDRALIIQSSERADPLSSVKRAAQRDGFDVPNEEAKMKLSILLSVLVIATCVVASSEPASAVVYCQYISYPAGGSV